MQGRRKNRRGTRDVLAAQRSIIALVVALKGRPCADCRRTFPPVCMDFDHVLGPKVAEISLMLKRPALYGIGAIIVEVGKCEVVCANCHRIRTARRSLRPRGDGPPDALAVDAIEGTSPRTSSPQS